MQLILTKRSAACIVALTLILGLAASCLALPGKAFADNTAIDEELAETQARVEAATREYNEIAAKADALQQQIEENLAKIEEIEALLPYQEEKCATALVALYKMQQDNFTIVNMILSAGTLQEFLQTIEYISAIHQSNANEVARLRVMKEDLGKTKQELQSNKMAADAERNRAEDALKEASAAREEAHRRAQEEAARRAEIARQEAERAAAEAKRLEDERAAQNAANGGGVTSGGGGTSGGGEEASGGTEGTPNPEPPYVEPLPEPVGVDWSADKTAFINEWAPRIDAYLAGSPLGGYGRVFAESAWNYGVDPRFSPAISCTESSKGRYCFLPHNAWGWGYVSWNSWEEAIDAHTRGLALGYGGNISVWGAQKYCPPSWEHWYYFTLSEMERI